MTCTCGFHGTPSEVADHIEEARPVAPSPIEFSTQENFFSAFGEYNDSLIRWRALHTRTRVNLRKDCSHADEVYTHSHRQNVLNPI